MGIPVLLIGRSGSGKSASMRSFDKDVLVVNVTKKPFPFKKNEHLKAINCEEYSTIKKLIKASYDQKQIKSAVIDDAGYLMTNKFMTGHRQLVGNKAYELYNDIGDDYYSLIKYVSDELPEDEIVYFIMHEEMNEMGYSKPKTIGRLLDEKVCVEGMFTVVLRSLKRDNKYVFATNTDGLDVTKSPIGMFDNEFIDNDLSFVDKAIREYYGLEKVDGKR